MTQVGVPHSVAAALPTLSVFDITNEVSRDVSTSGVERGIAYVTASVPNSLVRVSERESGFFCDIESLLERILPGAMRDRQRLLLAVLGPRTEQIPFEGGRLCLGQWQRVLLFCFDGDTRAEYTLMLLGS
ncbi:MAG TPA: YjbQ family protein [Gaiellaceae bacterium]|nr:YjbQ family protein [Gaiellaceae bacterium]